MALLTLAAALLCVKVLPLQSGLGVSRQLQSTMPVSAARSGGEKKAVRTNRPKGKGRLAQGRRRGDLVRGIIDEPPSEPKMTGQLESDPLLPVVECIVKAADMRKASDSVAYYVAPLTEVCSFVVLTNGRSRLQNDAIAAAVVDDIEAQFDRKPQHVEGGSEGGWTLIDYGDIIVNVMTPKSREYYDIDAVWQYKARSLDLSHLVTPDSAVMDDSDLLQDAFFFNNAESSSNDEEWTTWLDDDDDPTDILAQAKSLLEDDELLRSEDFPGTDDTRR